MLSDKDVIGTTVGLDGGGKAVARVFTAKSAVDGIPKDQDGVGVVAQVTGPIDSLGLSAAPVPIPTAQSTIDLLTGSQGQRPIGGSTGHVDITAGKIGTLVIDGSNVYSNENLQTSETTCSNRVRLMESRTWTTRTEPSAPSSPSFLPIRPTTPSTRL